MEAAVPPHPPRANDCPGIHHWAVLSLQCCGSSPLSIGRLPVNSLYLAGTLSPASSAGACRHSVGVEDSGVPTIIVVVVVYGL